MTGLMLYKKELLSLLGDLKNLKILDYGCGRGDFIELMLNQTPKKIHAVDCIQSTVAEAEINFQKYVSNGTLSMETVEDPNFIEDKFDRIICHNVLECIENKVNFIDKFDRLLLPQGIFLLSHHDFDSAIYNSSYRELTRELIHNFADTQQKWQEHGDGQMGHKIPGIIEKSVFKGRANCFIIRKMERVFSAGNYGYLMANMIMEVAKKRFDNAALKDWYEDLDNLSKSMDYYFAIDLLIAMINR